MEQIGPAYVTSIVSSLSVIGDLSPLLQAITLSVIALGFAGIATKLVTLIAKQVTTRTKTKADDILLDHVEKPLIWVVFAGLLYVAVAPLLVPTSLVGTIRGLLDTIFIVTLGILATRISHALFRIWQETISDKLDTVRDETLLPLLSKFATGAIWILTVILVLSSWGLEVGPFLAGLGIFGIALGFGIKDSLGNIFGGISLALDAAYKVGDRVKLESGVDGFVRDISLRSTRIETFDGDMVMVPNGNVANEEVKSFTQPTTVTRVTVPIGVGYGSDIEKVESLFEDIVNNLEGIEKEPAPKVVFDEMADSAITFKAFFWADYGNAVSKKREATRKMYEALTREGIDIPYPTRTVHLEE